MTARSVLVRPQGLHPRALAPTCYATGDISKMHYFSNKFSKIAKRLLIFNIGDLKFRDLDK